MLGRDRVDAGRFHFDTEHVVPGHRLEHIGVGRVEEVCREDVTDVVTHIERLGRLHRLAPDESMALALLDGGAAALLAPIAANHGMSVSMEAQFALRWGASLGEILKSTYDDVFMAANGALTLGIAEEGRPHGRDGYIMQGGGSNRILIGDPALRPFSRAPIPNESVEVEKRGDGFRIIVDRKEGAREALVEAGLHPAHPAIARAVDFVRERQNPDGGWGEDLRSYEDVGQRGRGESTASQTAWALLALLAHPLVEKAERLPVERRKQDDGHRDILLVAGRDELVTAATAFGKQDKPFVYEVGQGDSLAPG